MGKQKILGAPPTDFPYTNAAFSISTQITSLFAGFDSFLAHTIN